MEVMGVECKLKGVDKWGHLLHGGHAAHVPLTDVLVEDRRVREH